MHRVGQVPDCELGEKTVDPESPQFNYSFSYLKYERRRNMWYIRKENLKCSNRRAKMFTDALIAVVVVKKLKTY